LRPGATFEEAQAEMTAIGARLTQAIPDTPPTFVGFGVNVVPMLEQFTGRTLTLALWVLLGGAMAAWAESQAVTLIWSKGSVMVRRAGTPEYAPATERMPLAPGDIIRTDGNAEAVLLFPGRGPLKLRPNMVFRVPGALGDGEWRRREWKGPQLGETGPRPGTMGMRREGKAPPIEAMGPRRDDGRRGMPEKGSVVTPPVPVKPDPRGMGRPGPWPPLGPGAPPRPPFPEMQRRSMPWEGRSLPPGSAMVRRSGTRMFVPLTADMTLNPGDLVRTGPNVSVTLHFADGSQVRVKQNCSLLIPATAGRTAVMALRPDRAP
jgi:hypothetical protein